MKRIKGFIKRHPTLFNAVFFLQHFPREVRSYFLPLMPYNPNGYPNGGPLQNDPHWQSLAKKILKELPATSVVETGTYRGDTTVYLSECFPRGPVYTCEVVGLFYREDRHRFSHHSNIEILRGSSPGSLRRLAEEKKFGDLPVFLLDAHWYDYWPLPDELDVIAKLPKAVIMIDDFLVPGRPHYGYDYYTDRETGRVVNNDLAFIEKFLDPKRHRILFPKYGSERENMRGYIIIFQNLSAELDTIVKDPNVAADYEPVDLSHPLVGLMEPAIGRRAEE